MKGWPIAAAIAVFATAIAAATLANLLPFPDPTGWVSTNNVHGPINLENPFFQSLGTNGRSCATCHVINDAFGLSAADANLRFIVTGGTDPLFNIVDGANCPSGSQSDSSNHTLLLQNGLIRISLATPTAAQFQMSVASDPYGCAITTNSSTGQEMASVYRRPLPSTNLGFLSQVMSDGRETIEPLDDAATFQANLVTDLMHQALDATTIHAQATTPLTTAQQTAIVNFLLGFASAQVTDNLAGNLFVKGAQGGPRSVSKTPYYPGINDAFGGDPQGAPFNSNAFTAYAAWADLASGTNATVEAARASIAAGEAIFDTHPLTITHVRGLNDNAALGSPASITGTCTTCHDTPNVGNHSFPLPLDTGTNHDPAHETDPLIVAGLSQLSVPSLPVYEISGCKNPFPGTGAAGAYHAYATDPGVAFISGLCSDVERTKVPVLRGLAARAPYFHNGSGATLAEVVSFYNLRFQMNLTQDEENDLIAFLNSL